VSVVGQIHHDGVVELALRSERREQAVDRLVEGGKALQLLAAEVVDPDGQLRRQRRKRAEPAGLPRRIAAVVAGRAVRRQVLIEPLVARSGLGRP
jgi:hypothetical protein